MPDNDDELHEEIDRDCEYNEYGSKPAPMASQHADQVEIVVNHCVNCKYTRCRDRKWGA